MKQTIRTKTFWTALAAIATGVGLICAGDKPEGVNLIAGGLMAIFLRDGIKKAEQKE